MKVKNVIRGLMKEFDLEEINIITDDKVIFSGTVESWNKVIPLMEDYQEKVKSSEVKKRLMFNNSKAFIFI